jgi:putative tricarboxylic transport membrane protein
MKLNEFSHRLHRTRGLATGLTLAVSVIAAGAFAPPALAIDNLKIMAPAAPGGGYDRTARAMQYTLDNDKLATNIQVSNVGGAGGAIGMAQFVRNDKGAGNSMIIGGFGMVASFLTNKSDVTLKDVTPIARLTGEYSLVVVPTASKIKTLKDLTDMLKKDPGSVSIAGGSAGGNDHIVAGLVAQAVGVEGSKVNYVAFAGGGDSLAALIGNQVVAGVGGYSELIAQVDAGKLRALGITAETRVPGINIPTLKEQGLDVALVNWRGVSAPPGINATQRKAYLDMVAKMVKSAAWKEELAKNKWSDTYLAGDDFTKYIAEENARVAKVLKSLGLLK